MDLQLSDRGAVGELGERATLAVCDTGDPAAVTAMANQVTSELGHIEIPVNCAAQANTGPMADDELFTQINVKVAGALRCARAFAPMMAALGFGRIVKNLADEYGPNGANVTVVHPGTTVTERFPTTLARMASARGSTPEQVRTSLGAATSIGRVVTAEEVADVITFLCSPRSVAVTGDAIAADGGVRGANHY